MLNGQWINPLFKLLVLKGIIIMKSTNSLLLNAVKFWFKYLHTHPSHSRLLVALVTIYLLSCPSCPVQAACLAILYHLLFICYPVQVVLSSWTCCVLPNCIALILMVWMSSLSCLGCPLPTVLPQLSCPSYPIAIVLPWLLLFYRRYLVSSFLFLLTCSGCSVLSILAWLFCYGYPVTAIFS